METKNLAELYDLPDVDWEQIRAVLDSGVTQAPDTGGPNRHTSWLATINPDGGPHVTAVGAIWVDGAFWICTSARSRKARNIARDPRAALSISTHEFDLTVEGDATQVTDPATVADMAHRWADGGWPAEPDASGTAITAPYSAPSAGPPPWHVYRLTPKHATALSTVDPGGATSWTF